MSCCLLYFLFVHSRYFSTVWNKIQLCLSSGLCSKITCSQQMKTGSLASELEEKLKLSVKLYFSAQNHDQWKTAPAVNSRVGNFLSNQKTELSRCATDLASTCLIVPGIKKLRCLQTVGPKYKSSSFAIPQYKTDGRRKWEVEEISFAEERNIDITF